MPCTAWRDNRGVQLVTDAAFRGMGCFAAHLLPTCCPCCMPVTDAFGNAMGQSIAEANWGGSTQDDRSTVYNDGDIGRSELRYGSAPTNSENISAFVDAMHGYGQGGVEDYEGVDVASAAGGGIGLTKPNLAAVGGTGFKVGGGLGLTASSNSRLGVSSKSDSSMGLELAGRFVSGVIHGAVDMVWQPVAQTLDLGQAGMGLLSSGKYEPTWLSGVSRNYASGMSHGETAFRAFAGSNPVTGIGLASYDLTSSALIGDWGGVAEGLGGMVGSYGLVKGGQRYFAPEAGAQLGMYKVGPRVEVTDPLVSPGNLLKPLPADQAPNFSSAQPVFLGGKSLYRIFDDVKAFADGRWWSTKPAPASEGSWRSGYAVPEEWNAGTYQANYATSGLWGWGGKAAPQAIMSFSDKFRLLGSEYRYGWIQPGGKYQVFINDSRSIITGPGLKTGRAPW